MTTTTTIHFENCRNLFNAYIVLAYDNGIINRFEQEPLSVALIYDDSDELSLIADKELEALILNKEDPLDFYELLIGDEETRQRLMDKYRR